MTFEETKTILIENKDLINNLTPSRPKNYAFNFLQKCFLLMEEEDPSKIEDSFLQDFHSLLLNFIDAAIKTRISCEEKKVLQAVSDLLYNVACNYKINCYKTELQALIILVETSKSLEDILYILIYLFNRMGNKLEEEPANSFLSRKYYTELNDFLSLRKSHDEKYNI